MSRWNLRRKGDKKFRSRAAFKQDMGDCSDEPWEKGCNKVKRKMGYPTRVKKTGLYRKTLR